MVNTKPTRQYQNVFSRPSSQPDVQQPRSGVGPDNPAPRSERIASHQPEPPENVPRAQQKRTKIPRSQNTSTPKRKRVQLILWVKPGVKREVERIAETEGVSVSATGAAFLEHMLQQNLHQQHQALLDPIIEKAIRKQFQSYSSRIALLLVRVAFAAEHTRELLRTQLRRQPGMTPERFNRILDDTQNAAKGKITYQSPQLASIIDAVEQWFMQREETSHAG